MKKILFIINPIAGTGKNNLKNSAAEILPGYDKEYVFTEYPGHASEIARNAIGKGYEAIVSVGGDGTLNEVATTLVNTNEKLGIVPTGSGNGVARHLKIPASIEKALTVLKNAEWFNSDVGQINQSYFLATCGFGFDARVAETFSRSERRGLWTYVQVIATEFFRYKSEICQFSIDGQKIKCRPFILTLANSSRYGEKAIIAPGAGLETGKLLCCVVSPLKWYSTPMFIFQFLTGKVLKNKNYKQFTCRNFELKNYTGAYHLDGEPKKINNTDINIKIIPGALKILIPDKNYNHLKEKYSGV